MKNFNGMAVCILVILGTLAGISAPAQNISSAISAQVEISKRLMVQNISRPDAHLGSVMAAPSKQNPNYYFNWIRDAALVFDTVLTEFGVRQGSSKLLTDYVDFSRQNQMTPNRSHGLGEPKFNADGSAFEGDWGRPQNDGPALRAITLIRFARILMDQGQQNYVRQKLYDGRIPTDSVIKADLEYVAHHWQEPGFDLWEEVNGMHFYTLMVQRRAMLMGAQLAQALGDGGAAGFYTQQAQEMSQTVMHFFDAQKGILIPTLNRAAGITYKNSGLDLAVELGVLHGYMGDGFLAPNNEIVLATALKLKQSFDQIYHINQIQGQIQRLTQQASQLGSGIGRYPEDKYNGYDSAGDGNPWFIGTATFAELYYRARLEFIRNGIVKVTAINEAFLESVASTSFQPGMVLQAGSPGFQSVMNGLTVEGDKFMRRILTHRGQDGSISEQFNRNTGFMQGAPNLTWSHASFLSAALWRSGQRPLR